MDSPNFITSPELFSIYEKIELYIMSNYPKCLITINSKSVSFGFPNEFTRIFLYQDIDQSMLILKITQDLSQPMGKSNGKLYKVKDMNDFQHIKSGIKVILECKIPKITVENTTRDNDVPDSKNEPDSSKENGVTWPLYKFFKSNEKK